MSLADALKTARPPEIVVKDTPVPKGWERGVSWSGNDGTVTTGPIDTEVNAAVWKELIADWGLDSEHVEVIDGSVKFKGWDTPVKGTTTGATIRLRSYSARVQQRGTATAENMADVEALCRIASKKNPPRKQPPPAEDAERGLLVALADFQMGKGEGGGSEATVNRVSAATGRILSRLAELKKVGRPIDVVYLVGLGDLVEGCSDSYEMLTWSADLSRRDQVKVTRRLILQMVDDITDAGYRIVLSGVAGNHGENRKNGKAFTDWEDNDDLAVVEMVGEILAANPERYANVSVYLPEMLSMTLDICGVNVGFAHGHQMRGGGANAAVKVEKWWSGQIVGNQPTASARILVTGHLHHFICSEGIGRTHFQCPAMDGGSQWFVESSGQSAPAGMLTLGVGAVYGDRGYGDVEIL